ncbi:acetylxylan esterase [Cohnella mopanensis]|uniref:acetylxylan esterase n=1 Tax=Cohnella mopanensis TaxID=2911966 RepID=UPI001EF763E9|nr:acetylxylan esterase [Cohnella mopanensis]
MSLEELRNYRPRLTKPDDFDAFWEHALEELSETPVQVLERIPVEYPSDRVRVFRIAFAGFRGARIEALLALPAAETGTLPGLVTYHGYNWSPDGDIHETATMALHGYAVLHMLVRGQQGGSADNVVPSHGHVIGWLTKGILSPEQYYYRAVYMDAVRAVEVLASLSEVDALRIGVAGTSQGGALTLAAAAFSSIPIVACADYPGFTNFERILDFAFDEPYREFGEFFKRNSDPEVEEQARRTLAYHDIMNIGMRIRCHTWICIGLVDTVTPPSTVFAAYNHLQCPKDISVHRYHGHEFISNAHTRKLLTLREHLKP